jgi:transmembrane sensor
MNHQRLKTLLDQYRKEKITLEEMTELNQWFHSLNFKEVDFEAWIGLAGGTETMADTLYFEFTQRLGKQTIVRRLIPSNWLSRAAAAVILIGLGVGGYEYFHHKQKGSAVQYAKNDILPGGNKAILILSNGKQINVTNAVNGKLAQQAGVIISKTAAGQVTYSPVKNSNSVQPGNTTEYNTMKTPNGGKFSLKLPDGSLAILDAASSIKYPVAFNSRERKVEITGQVYFEVVHRADQPFRVAVNNELIEDIGTHFNINAYQDEPATKTTLLDGSVKVSTKPDEVILQPGQQASVDHGDHTIKISTANVAETIAWKNDQFRFSNTPLRVLMRQIARWYDVEVVYEGNVVNEPCTVIISRNDTLSKFLKILGNGDVHYRIEGRKLILLP